MLYTIKCRRGHCGSRFEHEGTSGDPIHDTKILDNRAASQGWFRETTAGGWLCPFDAPKELPISPPMIECSGEGCLNACLQTDETEAISMGWHSIDVPKQATQWLCTRCWKASQPEKPKPTEAEVEKWLEQTLARDESRIRQIARAIAKEEIGLLAGRMWIKVSKGMALEAALESESTEMPF